jgi:hypothetical protein
MPEDVAFATHSAKPAHGQQEVAPSDHHDKHAVHSELAQVYHFDPWRKSMRM